MNMLKAVYGAHCGSYLTQEICYFGQLINYNQNPQYWIYHLLAQNLKAIISFQTSITHIWTSNILTRKKRKRKNLTCCSYHGSSCTISSLFSLAPGSFFFFLFFFHLCVSTWDVEVQSLLLFMMFSLTIEHIWWELKSPHTIKCRKLMPSQQHNIQYQYIFTCLLTELTHLVRSIYIAMI